MTDKADTDQLKPHPDTTKLENYLKSYVATTMTASAAKVPDEKTSRGGTNGSSQSQKKISKVDKEQDDDHQQEKKLNDTPSDDRDEQGQKCTPGSSPPENTQPRAPPSPIGNKSQNYSLEKNITGINMSKASIFDWPGEEKTNYAEPSSLKHMQRDRQKRRSPTNQRDDFFHRTGHEESSFNLFGHSFDTLSETGDYFRDMNQQENYELLSSPAGNDFANHHNPDTPRIEIALPELGRSNSDCSLVDVSPIKIANRHVPPATTPAADATYHRRMAGSGHHSLRHVSHATSTVHGGMPMSIADSQTPGASLAGPRYDYGYHFRQHDYPRENEEHVSNPFFVIRSCHRAFAGCTYLLPCLRENDMISVNLNRYGHIRRYQNHPETQDADSMELVIATRRIETAICVFGGNLNLRRPSRTSSIFRLKSSSSTTKQRYEQHLSQRYHFTEGQLSWDVESNPPIDVEQTGNQNTSSGVGEEHTSDEKDSPHVIVDYTSGDKPNRSDSSSPSLETTETPKMKYRCKLCGQLKQNHNCTFHQSLQRSIGIQVYSAVNAYTACEPGSLAPPLSKMNNFVSYDSSGGHGSPTDEGYARTTDYHHHAATSQCHPSTVTPQTVREGGVVVHSPQSSLSTHSQDLSPHGCGGPQSSKGTEHVRYHVHFSNPPVATEDRKRSHSQIMDGPNEKCSRPHAAFVPAVSLRPEHYRAVTAFRGAETSSTTANNAYQYPLVPLSFAERKRLSDTLFYLSKEIPQMTQDCAAVCV